MRKNFVRKYTSPDKSKVIPFLAISENKKNDNNQKKKTHQKHQKKNKKKNTHPLQHAKNVLTFWTNIWINSRAFESKYLHAQPYF